MMMMVVVAVMRRPFNPVRRTPSTLAARRGPTGCCRKVSELCTTCGSAVDSRATSGDFRELRWTTLGIQKDPLTWDDVAFRVTFVPESARPPGPEERCRTAARSFVAASHDGGPTGFWSTQRSRHNRGMIRPRRGTVVRHGATTGGSDEVPRWRHRGGRPGEAGSPHRFAGVEGSWRGMRAGFARCEQLAERRDAPTGSPGGGADKRNRPPA